VKRAFVRHTAGTVSFIYRFGAALLALSFCLLFSLPAFAGKTEPRVPLSGVDLQRRGSVQVLVRDSKGEPLPGGTLRIYGVASLKEKKGSLEFEITDAFSGCGKTSDDLFSDQSCAEDLVAYVEKAKPASLASAENKNGTVTFSQLLPGAYLVMQTESVPGYETMLPFILILPQLIDNEVIYDVTAKAKPVEPLPPGQTVIIAEKKVTVLSGAAPKDTLFSFVLTSETSGSPLPENTDAVYDKKNGTMTVSRTGEGTVKFGPLNFTAADVGKTYEYSIREVKGTASHYTYDTAVYYLTINVISADGGKTIIVTNTLKDANGKRVSSAVFQNSYNGGETPPEIPRTGQLWWPVLVMLPAGFLLAALGVFCLRRERMTEDETV
jgi:pilin isopeptide linkage protein